MMKSQKQIEDAISAIAESVCVATKGGTIKASELDNEDQEAVVAVTRIAGVLAWVIGDTSCPFHDPAKRLIEGLVNATNSHYERN